MERHREWRKLVKKLRRKRIRQKKAIKRDNKIEKRQKNLEQLPEYQKYIKDLEEYEKWEAEEEARIHKKQEELWLEREREAQKHWKQLQEKIQKIRDNKAKQEELIQQEWEKEQQLLREKEEKKAIELEKKLAEEKRIIDFIEHGGEIPEQLKVIKESNPDKPLCSFFEKTGACRFRNFCSRNHRRPGISRYILIRNFYTHFKNKSGKQGDYDTDIGLEYDDNELHDDFLQFYGDIKPEFENVGQVYEIIVCSNEEQHLSGNVYVEYSSESEAAKAFKIFNGRWYGGRVLSVEFVNIPSWNQAICGLYFRNRCPKGRTCNYLHVFQGPKRKHIPKNQPTSFLSNTRWSESPECEPISKRKSKYSSSDSSSDQSYSKRKYKKEDEKYLKRNVKKSRRSRDRSESSKRNMNSRKRYDREKRDIKNRSKSREKQVNYREKDKQKNRDRSKEKQNKVEKIDQSLNLKENNLKRNSKEKEICKKYKRSCSIESIGFENKHKRRTHNRENEKIKKKK